jgi:FKBP-type peptidyl-prolyl cis-trans isomerase FkpA
MNLHRLAALSAAGLAAAALALAPAARAADPGAEFAQKAAKEKGAVLTATGLVYKPIVEGTGAKPAATSTVKVKYKGTFPDGKVFDQSTSPITFPLNGVIKCWTEGLQLMKVGGKAQLVCPPSIAYGSRGAGSAVPPNATLVFEVELIAIQ